MIVDIALPGEGDFHNLCLREHPETYSMQSCKIMHAWCIGQIVFTKYIGVVDDDVDVHNTAEGLFRLCANNSAARS